MAFHNLRGRSKGIDPNGYVVVYYPEHPAAYKNGHVYYHRLKMENMLGRYLRKNELVHHKDENRLNNRRSNLELTTRSKHTSHHNLVRPTKGKRKGVPNRKTKSKNRNTRTTLVQLTLSCAYCSAQFTAQTISRQYCSAKCSGLANRKITHPECKELKRLVWKYPRTTLAKRFGVSDAAVSNWCKRLGIDMPPRGYWSKMDSKRMDQQKPSKKKLKKLIWSRSIPQLVKNLKVSESIIRRWCKEYKLKTPPPGYWSAKAL